MIKIPSLQKHHILADTYKPDLHETIFFSDCYFFLWYALKIGTLNFIILTQISRYILVWSLWLYVNKVKSSYLLRNISWPILPQEWRIPTSMKISCFQHRGMGYEVFQYLLVYINNWIFVRDHPHITSYTRRLSMLSGSHVY